MKYVIGILIIAVIVVLYVRFVSKRRQNVEKRSTANIRSETQEDSVINPEYRAELEATKKMRDIFARCPKEIELHSNVCIKGVWYVTHGRVFFEEGKWTWFEYRLKDEDTGERIWLTLEHLGDEGWKASIWQKAPAGVELPLSPTSKPIVYGGEKYTQEDDGTARYVAEGETDYDENEGNVEYYDYESKNGKLVSYERYGNDRWEKSVGEVVGFKEVLEYPVTF